MISTLEHLMSLETQHWVVAVWKRLVLAVILSVWAVFAIAQERVVSYDSQIQINADGSLQIIDTIVVSSEGIIVKRGIYRDFSLRWHESMNTVLPPPDITITKVTRNGQPEPWYSIVSKDFFRLYLGNAEVFIPAQKHRYKIHYEVAPMYRINDGHAQLQWSLIGSSWLMPVAKVSATINPPRGITAADVSAFYVRGFPEDMTQSIALPVNPGGSVSYENQLSFGPGEQIDLFYQLPSDRIAPPSALQRLFKAGFAHAYLFVLGGGLLLILLYLYFHAREQLLNAQPQMSSPIISPPATPQSDDIALLFNKKASLPALAALLIRLERLGVLWFSTDSQQWFIERPQLADRHLHLNRKEHDVLEALFLEDEARIVVSSDNAARFNAAMAVQRTHIDSALSDTYRVGRSWCLSSVCIMMLGLLCLSYYLAPEPRSISVLIPLLLSLVVFVIAMIVYRRAVNAFSFAGIQLVSHCRGLLSYLRGSNDDATPDAHSYEVLLPYAAAFGIQKRWYERCFGDQGQGSDHYLQLLDALREAIGKQHND